MADYHGIIQITQVGQTWRFTGNPILTRAEQRERLRNLLILARNTEGWLLGYIDNNDGTYIVTCLGRLPYDVPARGADAGADDLYD